MSRPPSKSRIAERFLEDGEIELEVKAAGGLPASARAGNESKGIFGDPDKYAVDQRINLMDVNAAKYDGQKRNDSLGSSLVDIFFDESNVNDPSTMRPGDTRRSSHGVFMQHSRSKSCLDTYCSVPMVGLIGIALVFALFGISSLGSNSGDSSNVDLGTYAGDRDSLSDGDLALRLADIRSHILNSGVTTSDVINDKTSPSAEAFDWLVNIDPRVMDADDEQLVQRFSLAVLFYATNRDDDGGLLWKKDTNWMTGNDECSWYGVDCENLDGSMQEVVHLNLTSNSLMGNIPSEILQGLRSLVVLDLSNNRLSGTIPESIGSAADLKFLYLSKNQLKGNLPDALSALKKLEIIDLAHNLLSGSFPEFSDPLSDLRGLYVNDNFLTGKLPDFHKMPNLYFLHLNHNMMSGHLPYHMFRLENIVEIRAGKNSFTGTIPPEIESLHKLRVLSVPQNNLNGSIPNVLNRDHTLIEIDLKDNSLGGELPPTLGAVDEMEYVILSGNRFTGAIPAEWGGLNTTIVIELARNKIDGAIPNEFGDLESLRILDLSSNEITGTIPTELGMISTLEHLNLHLNKLTGLVPTEVGRLKRLVSFEAFNNLLNGSLPIEVCILKNKNDLNYLSMDCVNEVECGCCDKCY